MDSTKIRPRLFARLASASLLALVFMHAARAERLESPLELMYAPGTMIVAGKLVDINPAGRIVLERKDVLGGEDRPPDQIDVRVPKDALGTVKTGERYVVAYSMYQRTSHKAIGGFANEPSAYMMLSCESFQPWFVNPFTDLCSYSTKPSPSTSP